MHPDTRKVQILDRELQTAEATIRRQRAEIERLKAELRNTTTTATSMEMTVATSG